MYLAGIGALCASMTGPAEADDWAGPDKAKHAAAGALVGSLSTLATKDADKGCLAAAAVGAAKEAYDALHRDSHTPSVKDFIVTAAAGCAAAYGTGWVLLPGRVVYSKEF
jgi:hypothetical protein